MRLDRHLDYYFDVQDQGADPTGSVDSSAAFTNCCYVASLQPGGGTVVAVGKFKISSTVIVFSGAKLDLTNALIIPGADVNLFQLKPQAQINGGIFDTTGITYTHSCVYLNGQDKFWSAKQIGGNLLGGHSIRNIQFDGNAGVGTGKAIFLECQGGANPYYVYGLLMQNIRIHGYEYGIYGYRSGTAGQSFVNGNRVSNLWARDTVHLIRFEAAVPTGGDTSGNIFRDIDFEWGANTVEALYLDGATNQFSGQIWDIIGTFGIQLPATSNHNRIVSNLTAGQVNNLGTNNTVVVV